MTRADASKLTAGLDHRQQNSEQKRTIRFSTHNRPALQKDSSHKPQSHPITTTSARLIYTVEHSENCIIHRHRTSPLHCFNINYTT